MLDKFNRRINYLRISVTDRCNLRCDYCMPQKGVSLLPHKEILSFEEITEIARVAVDMGIDKVRLTGGEPLVRHGIIELVTMLSKIKGIEDLAMTTNGVLLKKYAKDLVASGLDRVNISLDALDARKYWQITRGGNIKEVLQGIEAALTAGLKPIKINCVIERSPDEKNARSVAKFAEDNDLEIRFIRKMELHTGQFWKVYGGDGGNCEQCNRLRLSSNGLIRPCLFSDLVFSTRKLGIKNAIAEAVKAKPKCGQSCRKNEFYKIGG